MSDELALFAVVGLLYLADCFLWVGKHSTAFVSWAGNRWAVKMGSRFIRTAQGGLLFLNPLPPLGEVFVCHLPPFSISPDGICSINGQTIIGAGPGDDDVWTVAFEEINSLNTKDKDLLINGAAFCRCKDARQAEAIRGLISKAQAAGPEEREVLIREFWDSQFDTQAAESRLAELKKTTKLRILCNSLFFYLFILSPALVLYFMRPGLLIPLAIGMVVLAVAIAVSFFRLHKQFHPTAIDERITNLVKMILCPPVSVRACDPITEPLMGQFNPMVVGSLILGENQLNDLAAVTLRNLKFPPLDHLSDSSGTQIIKWQNTTLLDFVSAQLGDLAMQIDTWLEPPLPNDPDAKSYCPRCLVQFTEETDLCPDCLGVTPLPLSSLASARTTEE